MNPIYGRLFRAGCWTLTALCFGYNFYAWGGLGLTPRLGEKIQQDANLHAPLAATYMGVGSFVLDLAGYAAEAKAFAADQFPGMPSPAEMDRREAFADARAAQTGFGRFSYFGAPLIGLLSLALHLRRPRAVRSFGIKD
jgi:hypothetical protein